jgi:hypothetical protein
MLAFDSLDRPLSMLAFDFFDYLLLSILAFDAFNHLLLSMLAFNSLDYS